MIFDRYVLSQIAKPLLLTLVVALTILLAERLVRVVDIVLGQNGAVHFIVQMLTYIAPHYLGIALPLAFFLAMQVAISRMSQDSELDALRAAGISMHRLVRPLFMLTVLLTVVTAMIFSYLQPYGRYAYRAVISALENSAVHLLLKEDIFVSHEGRTLFIDEISPGRRQFRNIFVFEEEEDGASTSLTAKRGYVVDDEESVSPVARLESGVRQQLVPAEGPPEPSPETINTLTFDELFIPLGDGDLAGFRPRGRDEREYTLPEIWAFKDNPPEGISRERIVSELYGRIARILSVLALPFLALPLSLARRRGDRSYGLVFGIGLLYLYNEILKVGERQVARGEIDPLIGLWLPLIVFFSLVAMLYWRAAFRVPRSFVETFATWIRLSLAMVAPSLARGLEGRK